MFFSLVRLAGWLIVVGSGFCELAQAAQAGQLPPGAPEPDFQMACAWWPELENVWTPLGWKDHCVRFNVLYNGTIVIARPTQARNFMRRMKSVVGSGIQLDFRISPEGQVPPPETETYRLADKDGGVGRQGWADHAAPLLWTEIRQGDWLGRQEIFAHLAGGGDVQTAVEPLFAWIRLRLLRSGELAPSAHAGAAWSVMISNPHLETSMHSTKNLVVHPEKAALMSKLTLKEVRISETTAWLVLNREGKVLLAVAAGLSERPGLVDRKTAGGSMILQLPLPDGPEDPVELLLPAVPVEPREAIGELSLGWETALAEADRYWSKVPTTAARIDTPEAIVNQAMAQGLKLAQVLAIRHPDTGQYAMITGSWRYEALWSTPGCMVISMFLDTLGYHAVAEKYLEVFREEQGKVKPPGTAYPEHPGYFATPRIVDSIDWLTDHGAVLHAASYHALLTDDKRFIERWLPAIVRGCEFIRDSRALIGHGGVHGILPAARANDDQAAQSVWNDGWNYKGLHTAVQLLERVGHPRALEFRAVAEEYRRAFVQAFRQTAEKMGTWEHPSGRKMPLAPTSLPDGGDTSHPFYLDTGPLFLVYAGLLSADDPLMKAAVSYFREGPNVLAFDPSAGHQQPPCLVHELSSCEPCYSWNVFHSHALADRYRFLEGMYSLFAGGMSRQTFVACETRGGISGGIYTHPLAAYCLRLSVIDDTLHPGELHLLRLVPLVWLQSERPTLFENIPTVFGPLSVRFWLSTDKKCLHVEASQRFHHAPSRVILHVPPLDTLREVRINRRAVAARNGDALLLTKQLRPDGS